MTDQTERGMARLRNWSNWAVSGAIGMVLRHHYPRAAAVCGDYQRRNDECEDDGLQEPVDEIDAGYVEDALMKMPAHLCHAVQFHFTGRVSVNCIYRFERMPHEQLIGLVGQAARMLG